MKWLYRDSDAPSLDLGVERALDRLDAPIAVGWSRWIMDNSGSDPRPILRNYDGGRIPVEGRNPFYTFYAWDKVATRWVSFIEIERPDPRLPKALEKDLWLNRNKGSARHQRLREQEAELTAARAESRRDDQHHWILENKSYWRDALEDTVGDRHQRGAKAFSGPRHSYKGLSGEIEKTHREKGLTPHPSGRDEY